MVIPNYSNNAMVYKKGHFLLPISSPSSHSTYIRNLSLESQIYITQNLIFMVTTCINDIKCFNVQLMQSHILFP